MRKTLYFIALLYWTTFFSDFMRRSSVEERGEVEKGFNVESPCPGDTTWTEVKRMDYQDVADRNRASKRYAIGSWQVR